MKQIQRKSSSAAQLKSNEYRNVSITLPCDLSQELSKIAYKNKRKGVDPKSVSAIIRQALETAGYQVL